MNRLSWTSVDYLGTTFLSCLVLGIGAVTERFVPGVWGWYLVFSAAALLLAVLWALIVIIAIAIEQSEEDEGNYPGS